MFRLRAVLAATMLATLSCREPDPSAVADSIRDSAARDARPAQQGEPVVQQQDTTHQPRPVRQRLSPLAAELADRMVMAPRGTSTFVVAARAKRLLVDLGRIDVRPTAEAAWRAAYREVLDRWSPLPVGTSLALIGRWGTDSARVTGFDVWNGRIVATLDVPPALDSLARAVDPLAGLAQLPAGQAASATVAPPTATAAPAAPTATACTRRDTLSAVLAARVRDVRDSVGRYLRDSVKAPYPRLEQAARVRSWGVPGCFGPARVLVLVSRRAPTGEYSVERAILLDTAGGLTRMRVSDLRFRAHEPIDVFDADADGIDDVVTRAQGEFSGGTTVLRVDPTARTLTRVASGFVWESR